MTRSPIHRSGLGAIRFLTALIVLCILVCLAARSQAATEDSIPEILLAGVGDSLTHGTMDATNNHLNTLNAYLQGISESLAAVATLRFSQPFFTFSERRLRPFRLPTNLGVDGTDLFSLEGVEYYKRVGAESSYDTPAYLCDRWLPGRLQDDYDKVLYPLNLLAEQPVSQMDGLRTLLDLTAVQTEADVVVIFWAGNNDSSLAALGTGGKNPSFLPFPLQQITPEISPSLRILLEVARNRGLLSFEPYTAAAIERNLTELEDFTRQIAHLIDRLQGDSILPAERLDVMLLTLPYYSSVGYLFDSEDLEFYLRKIHPAYTVPPTFQRVAEPGEPIIDPTRGDRVSLFTFGFLYLLLDSGYSPDYVNQALEVDGVQNDGLVLSEAERRFIMDRIDGFNSALRTAADAADPGVFHVLDTGGFLNDLLTGRNPVKIGDRTLSRKWSRGGGFSLDGVHPGYTGQALIANSILEGLRGTLGLEAPLKDLEAVMETDPYVDRDGDGWVPGPAYEAAGLTDLLFIFRDPDDTNPDLQVTVPDDAWQRLSAILLEELLGIPSLEEEARRLGLGEGKKAFSRR